MVNSCGHGLLFPIWPCMHHSVVLQLSDHVLCNLTSELNEILMPIWSDYFSIRKSLSSDYYIGCIVKSHIFD